MSEFDVTLTIILPGDPGSRREARGMASAGIKRALGSIKHYTDPYQLEYVPDHSSGDPAYTVRLSTEKGEPELVEKGLREAAFLAYVGKGQHNTSPYSLDYSDIVQKLKDAGIYEDVLEEVWYPFDLNWWDE